MHVNQAGVEVTRLEWERIDRISESARNVADTRDIDIFTNP